MPVAVRRLLHALLGVVLALATLAGIGSAGVAVSMAESYPTAPQAAPGDWPAPPPVLPGRLRVAVLIGGDGTVVSDALAPYEVFARSSAFSVYTVAARRAPATLSGGLRLLPDHTLDDAPPPDLVVVPAVVDPTGAGSAPLRAWLTRQAARGARVLGVCAGAELVAATGLLDGRRATSFWANLDGLAQDYPKVGWLRGERYVEDGPVTTTAGVTSGVVGALRLVERLAGAADAQRIGGELAYPGWSLDGPTAIPTRAVAAADLPYGLNAAFPWFRPTLGVGLTDGVGELDVAAAFELYAGVSFAARAVPLGAGRTVTTRHGMVLLTEPVDGAPDVARLVAPGARGLGEVDPALTGWAARRGVAVELPHADRRAGESAFDPVLRDLATHADGATARATAKYTEYPAGRSELAGPAWPWRPTALAAVALLVSAGVGFAPTLLRRLARRRRREPSGS
ncbi:protein DJ-1 [Solihabitans fulvus]|uniref:Protein DJ-1 n=1 Tax=Solihabitans fulvus TaxID=1892852 RepID=A0A5B2XS85_9PSEU|nr:DJ-1/PfpI family protein [Solihabitans fulvus]KAA2265731.1 protein DJ-1 [Solihabitans fulvus]